MILKQVGCVLVGLAAHKTVEIIEAQARRPLVEGSSSAVLKRGGVVVLAKPRGGVAVISKDFSDGGFLRADDGIVARETGSQFADHAGPHRVMVATGNKRRARRRAESGGMKVVVAQPGLGDAVHRGVGMTPPKVLKTPKPWSSVMMSRMFGAPWGGTTLGAHQGVDSAALSLITPPNAGGSGGSCFPSSDVVALGEPRTPVIF
jgi:hypothetical protein